MPTVAGLWWLGCVFLLMLMGWGYANNLCLGLAVLLLSLSVIFLIECHFNVEGLSISSIHFEDQFEGQSSLLKAQMKDLTQRSRKDIFLRWDGKISSKALLKFTTRQTVEGEMRFPHFGKWDSPTIILESTFPLGLFKAWSFHHAPVQAWVYPLPLLEGSEKLIEENNPEESDHFKVSSSGDEPFESKILEPSDPFNRIDWKQFAKTRELRVKTFLESHTTTFSYEWPYLSGDIKSGKKLIGVLERHLHRNEKFSFKAIHLDLSADCNQTHRQRVFRYLTEVLS